MIGATNKNHMQKGGIKKPLAIGLGVGIVAIVVIVVIITQFYPGLFSRVEPVITEFMEAGAARDAEAAHACWSTQSVSEEQIAEYIESNYDDVFAGYERLTIQQKIEQSVAGITTCSVNGDIIYTGAGDPRSSFQAWLEKDDDGCWKITSIQIGYNSTALFPA